MKLKNKYVVGCLVQAYEMEMLPEYIESCKGFLEGIENPENVEFHFCINSQEYYEKYVPEFVQNGISTIYDLTEEFFIRGSSVIIDGKETDEDFYNIADYRRELNDRYCSKVDFVLWGETDSLWPKQTLYLIEELSSQQSFLPKCVISFATRVNWDSSWDKIRHPKWKDVKFVDNDEFTLANEASEKSYMTYARMNEINDVENIEIETFLEPKADGSCLIISSELIKSGVNIPRALIMSGEDESFLRMAKIVMGNKFIQYHFKDILRVHNRRHPRKRIGILNENNPRGFCDDRKGTWWKELEKKSKENLENLQKQIKFNKR